MDWIIVLALLIHLFISPFTKVEESFNLQACHDILYHGWNFQEYDHTEFPGVVPRTFIGPIIVSSISYPFVAIIQLFGLSKFYSQYIVRFILGILVLLAWRKLRLEVEKIFGYSVALWFTVITASQFHFIYYMSRTLPNIFALIFVLLSFVFWLKQEHAWLIYNSGVAVLIFRSEVCMLLGPMLLYDLSKRRLHILTFLKHAIPAGLLCLCATLTIDSWFWSRLLWPEGEVFWFNSYQNQSHLWGSYPFLWYWYSCLPRALGVSLVLVPMGFMIDSRIRLLVSPALLFIALYSLLPHKELRFIIYIFPLLNISAARACHFFWTSRKKSLIRQVLALFSVSHIILNLLFSSFLLIISSYSYPGGAAIQSLHKLVPPSDNVSLHIDNLSAQTGVSRFNQIHSHWRYNKTENLKAGGQELHRFTHLLVEAKSKSAYNLKHYIESHDVLGSVEAFSHLSFNYINFPPIKLRVKPMIYLLKNKKINEEEPESLITDVGDDESLKDAIRHEGGLPSENLREDVT